MTRILLLLGLGACLVGDADDPSPSLTLDATSSTSRGINVDAANPHSRPCSSLGSNGLRVGGFVRMPIKFTSADWTWDNGGFEGYVDCVRATVPGVQIVGTVGEATVDPSAGVPSNPYYAHVCDPNDLDMTSCPQFAEWLAAFLEHTSPTILGHFDIIEVFNEPDDTWNGSRFTPAAGTTTHSSMPPKAYAQLLDAFYDKFRGPVGAPIIMGGMDSGQTSYLTAMRPYRSDMVNIHPYGAYPSHTPNFTFDPAAHVCTSSFGTLNPCFGPMEQALSKYSAEDSGAGNSGVVLITEWGTANGAQQSDLIRAFFHDPTTRSANAAMFAFSDANKAGFGVVDATDGHKPSYNAFAHP
jgi:hypothetical protein